MIRRCAVFGCDNTDEIALGHHFPDDRSRTQVWKERLQLQEFPIELLQTKFCVCTEHFTSSDYEDDDYKKLRFTAIPNLKEIETESNVIDIERCNLKVQVDEIHSSTSVSPSASESIEIVAPTRAIIALLHPPTATGHNHMHHSCQSAISNSNTAYSHDDICILETHGSHYEGDSFIGAEEDRGILMQSLDAPDFTVLHAEDDYKYECMQKRHSTSAFDESTEVLLVERSECHRNAPSHAISGTDSDVEILMSEEILDSDWSAAGGNGCVGDLVALSSTDSGGDGDEKLMIFADASINQAAASIPSSASNKFMECTDHDLSGGDFSFSQHSINGYENLSRLQLLNIIKEQSAKIRHMETLLNRYREAQRIFFQQVDILRAEVNDCGKYDDTVEIHVGCVELDRSHETINN